VISAIVVFMGEEEEKKKKKIKMKREKTLVLITRVKQKRDLMTPHIINSGANYVFLKIICC
jgi:hypothetical protein